MLAKLIAANYVRCRQQLSTESDKMSESKKLEMGHNISDWLICSLNQIFEICRLFISRPSRSSPSWNASLANNANSLKSKSYNFLHHIKCESKSWDVIQSPPHLQTTYLFEHQNAVLELAWSSAKYFYTVTWNRKYRLLVFILVSVYQLQHADVLINCMVFWDHYFIISLGHKKTHNYFSIYLYMVSWMGSVNFLKQNKIRSLPILFLKGWITVLLTSGKRRYVVIGVSDGDGDWGGDSAASFHSCHVLSFNHHHMLALFLPIQGVHLGADHTCRATEEVLTLMSALTNVQVKITFMCTAYKKLIKNIGWQKLF